MKAPGDGPLLGRGVPTRTAGARGRKPGARRGLLGAGRVPWRAEPASPSRSASSPPRPCTQRWRPQSCGGHRGAVRPVPGEAPPLRPCPSVTRAGAGNSSAEQRGQRIIPGRSAPAWWAGAWGWTRPSCSADTPPSQLSASSSGPQETPRGLQRRRTAPPAGWLCSGPHSACVGGAEGGLLGCPGVPSPPPGKGRGQGGDCGVAGCSGCSHDAGVWRAESQGREAGRVGLGLCPQRPPRRRCARAGTIHRAPSGRWTVFASHYVAELAAAARTAAECSVSGGLINQGPAGGSGASKVIRGGRRPAPPCWAAGPDPRVPA